jgi:hypothetical protein
LLEVSVLQQRRQENVIAAAFEAVAAAEFKIAVSIIYAPRISTKRETMMIFQDSTEVNSFVVLLNR